MYKSTRGYEKLVSSSYAIINGLAEDKGLYVPFKIHKLKNSLEYLAGLPYEELAFCILKEFLDDFCDDDLRDCIYKAYDKKFEDNKILQIKSISNTHFLELYHGPTLAFKDVALCLFPYLLNKALINNKQKENILILTATSGDTGKAALEGFSDIPRIKIAVLYPKDGTSLIQKLQMITHRSNNSLVISLNGNFDDAQNCIKNILNDSKIKKEFNDNGFILSSANSINIGRLFPQIVYYFYAYGNLLNKNIIKHNEKINIVVPTGNFGNILSAYYAKKLGLPINKLICASNENNVLFDFINTGIYDRRRILKVTNSPSMDILISSNLERLLYDLSNEDSILIKNLMNSLEIQGFYEIPKSLKEKLNKIFYSDFATEKESINAINKVYKNFNYLMDPHTAVAYSVYEKYKEKTKDKTQTIIASTASPFKFPKTILQGLNVNTSNINDIEALNILSKKTTLPIPTSLKNLDKKPIIHNNICPKDKVLQAIENFAHIGGDLLD